MTPEVAKTTTIGGQKWEQYEGWYQHLYWYRAGSDCHKIEIKDYGFEIKLSKYSTLYVSDVDYPKFKSITNGYKGDRRKLAIAEYFIKMFEGNKKDFYIKNDLAACDPTFELEPKYRDMDY